MTIPSENREITHNGTGTGTVFGFDWRILNETDIGVYVRDAAGLVTPKVLSTDYTVTIGATSGSVTFNVAPAATELVQIVLEQPLTQPTSYPTSGRFPASAHETVADRMVNGLKSLRYLVDRALGLPPGETSGSGGYDAKSNKIINLAPGSANTDAATISDVDAKIAAAVLDEAGSTLISALGAGYRLQDTHYQVDATGTVARALESRLAEVWNVKDFGAVGDGSTDDGTNIQQAIDAVEAAGGGVLFFPAGVYITGQALTVTREVILRGVGRGEVSTSANPVDGVSVLRAETGSALSVLLTFQSATSGEYIYGAGVESLVIDGNNTATTALAVVSASEFVIRDSFIFRATGTGLLMTDGNGAPCMRPMIDNVHVSCGANAAASAMIGVRFLDISAGQGGVVQCYVTRLITLTDDGDGFQLFGSDNANIQMFQGFVLTGGTGKGLIFKNGTHFEPRNHRFGWVNVGQSGGGQGTIEAESNAFGIVLEHVVCEDGQIVIASGAQVSYRLHDNVTGAQYETLRYKMTDERLVPIGAFRPITASSGIHASLWDCVEFDAAATEAASASLGSIDDWEDGEITGVKLWFAMAGANSSANARIRARVLAAAEGEATATPQGDESFTVAVNDTANRVDVHEVTFASAVAFTRGDFLAMEIARIGGDAADTATGDLHLLGAALIYQATGPAGASQGPWGVTEPQV